MGMEKKFGIHFGDLVSRSVSYRSGTQFSLSPRWSENHSSNRYKLGRDIPLVTLSTWLNLEEFCKKNSNFFFVRFQIRFSPFEHSICHILGIVGPIDVKQKGNESTGCCIDWSTFDLHLWPWPLTLNFQGQIVSREWEAQLSWNERDGSRWDALMWNTKEMSRLDTALAVVPMTLTFDLEFWRSNCISGMGGPIVMERKGRESIGCPHVKHKHYLTSRQRILLGTGVT